MSLKNIEQICPNERPGVKKELKKRRVRRERRRRKANPEAPPEDRRFCGYSI